MSHWNLALVFVIFYFSKMYFRFQVLIHLRLRNSYSYLMLVLYPVDHHHDELDIQQAYSYQKQIHQTCPDKTCQYYQPDSICKCQDNFIHHFFFFFFKLSVQTIKIDTSHTSSDCVKINLWAGVGKRLFSFPDSLTPSTEGFF